MVVDSLKVLKVVVVVVVALGKTIQSSMLEAMVVLRLYFAKQ